MPSASKIDVAAYFGRIGLSGPATPTLATLHAIAAAHVVAIPFNNLDILLGAPVSLEPVSLERKLVLEGRGGYCFEQNGHRLPLARRALVGNQANFFSASSAFCTAGRASMRASCASSAG